MDPVLDFYKDKTVLVTGHTGFKGSWMTTMLVYAGAKVVGYSNDEGRLLPLSGVDKEITSIIGDVRDLNKLMETFEKYQPEVVIHMAAQAIVRKSYKDPIETYSTNIMGTVNVLECIRATKSVKSVIIVTTDKVYENKEWDYGYREIDPLGGFDPYSNSKACAELITASYKNAYFLHKYPSISTVRAGNVIGGGDLISTDRIIPDCIKSALLKEDIQVRNPFSIRPYQHVLEPVYAYLLIAASQYNFPEFAGTYNIGPNEEDTISTGDLVTLFTEAWGDGLKWYFARTEVNQPHEAKTLELDCSKFKKMFDWAPRWDIKTAVQKTVEWTKAWAQGENGKDLMIKQIKEYTRLTSKISTAVIGARIACVIE